MASSLETNKLIAAVLTAGVIASGTGVLSRILYHSEAPEQTAYVIEVTEEGEGEAAAEAKTPLGVLLASADAAAGESAVRACAACHSFEEGGGNKVGPALHGVVGREIASVADFTYSEALAGMDGAWDYEALNGFLEDPRGWAPGTNMAYAGIGNDEDRADVIVYLRSISPDAPPLPEPEETQAAEAEAGATEAEGGEAGGGVLAMIADADPAAGESAARKCAACHSFEEGGANKIGPALHGVVGREIAAVEDFAYSDALAGMDGAWDDQALAGFLADPKGWAPGTKMTFAGVQQEQELAELIAYLRSVSPDAPPPPEAGGGDDQAGAEGEQPPAEASEQPPAEASEQPAEGEGEQPATGEQPAADQQQAATADPDQAEGEQPPAGPTDAPDEGVGEQQAGTSDEQAEGEQQQQAAVAEPEEASGDQQAAGSPQEAEGGGAIVAMIAEADPASGETSAKRKCAVCHSFEEGGPNKVGPNLHGVVGSDIAAVEGFNYSGALQEKEGSWDYQALDAFLADPRGWAQGTRMAFAGLKDEQERAEVISYLRSISPDAPPPAQ